MSRSLTAAARRRYAPEGLCVLWESVGTRTAAERFVEIVAGRWERSCLDLEEQLEARLPAVTWSKRSPARSEPPGPRARPAFAAPAAGSTLDEEWTEPEEGQEAPSGPEPGDFEPIETERRAARPRVPSSARSRGARPADASRGAGPVPRERPSAVPRSDLRRRESVARPVGSHASPARAADRRSTRWNDATEALEARTPSVFGAPAGWDPAEDIDEPMRRRFDQWSLEGRWRDEALEEWRRQEF